MTEKDEKSRFCFTNFMIKFSKRHCIIASLFFVYFSLKQIHFTKRTSHNVTFLHLFSMVFCSQVVFSSQKYTLMQHNNTIWYYVLLKYEFISNDYPLFSLNDINILSIPTIPPPPYCTKWNLIIEFFKLSHFISLVFYFVSFILFSTKVW